MKTIAVMIAGVMLSRLVFGVETNATKRLLYSTEPAQHREGLERLRMLGSQGDATALMTLAEYLRLHRYEAGDGELLKLYRAASALRCGEAYYWWAMDLKQGDGIHDSRPRPQIAQDVAYLCNQAILLGCVKAKTYLASMYMDGDGLPKNFVYAAKLFEEAGEYTRAAMALGYLNGDYLVEAYKFAKLGCYAEHTITDQLRFISPRLSPEQITDGDHRYEAYKRAMHLKPKEGKDIFTEH